MQREKFKILLYLKKSGLDKLGQAPIGAHESLQLNWAMVRP